MPSPTTTVFLSSTAKDLQRHRDAVHAAILKMDGYRCVRMEDFGARDWESDEFCRQKVAECDVFVALIGHLNGSTPKDKKRSYTEREYEAAKTSGKPRLIFLAAKDLPVPADLLLSESDTARRRQQSFRRRVMSDRLDGWFSDPTELGTAVVNALRNLEQERRRRGKKPAAASSRGRAGAKGNRAEKIYIGGPGEEVLRKAYLSRVIAETGFLSLSGVDPAVAGPERDARLRLGSVYTALMTRSNLESGRVRTLADVSSQGGRRLSALEQLNGHPRLVLLGDPGSGKSTFINFVALCLAGEALSREDASLKLLTSPLPAGEEAGRHEEVPQTWDHGALLPVRVVLRDFAARGLPEPGAKASAEHLWEFLAAELARAGLGKAVPLIQRELLGGRGLVLLDGLDEVPEAESRREQIRQSVEDFSKSLGDSRVALTSRTYAYEKPEWRLFGFEDAVLAPFTRGQIARFVELWYEEMASLGRFGKEDAVGRAVLLQRAIFSSDRLRALAERPLLLALMSSLHAWRGGSLPERREELYGDAVELLLNTWEKQRVVFDRSGRPMVLQPSLAEWLKVDREEVRRAIEELAYEAHRSQPDLAGTADIEEGRLVAKLLHLGGKGGVEADAVQLVAFLRDRAGLLVERGPGVYTLPHRTFQEYLAARHLTGGSFPDEVARLGREDPGRWREVVLLAGAKAARGAVASVWQLADALCFWEPGGPGVAAADEWGALLAGQALAESADLARVAEPNVAKLARVRRWLVALLRAEGFPVRERAAAGKALAVLGDPRFDPERWSLPRGPALGFMEIPGGSFRMGGDKERDPPAFDDELPAHELTLPTFYMARFPVTVVQFHSFVEASGYRPPDSRSLEGRANHPVVHVTWNDALAYCRWLAERLGELARERSGAGEAAAMWSAVARGELGVTLPSEAEWEKAARAADGRIFPWGDRADENRANFSETGLRERSTVGCFPSGASPYGCEEMSGNVWEWTRSLLESYPYLPEDGREDLQVSERSLRALRGGAFDGVTRNVRCAVRGRVDPESWYGLIGFRVVLSPFRS